MPQPFRFHRAHSRQFILVLRDLRISLDSLAIPNALENDSDEVFRAPKAGAPLCVGGGGASIRIRLLFMGADAIAVLEEEQHLLVPIAGRERSALRATNGIS